MSQTLHFETVPLSQLCDAKLQFDRSDYSPVVLVVDDERVIADTLAAILTQSGFACMVAYNAEDALEIAQVIPPQLLITDVAMPGMSGIELAIEVRALAADCQVLLFSGQATTADQLADPKYAIHNFVLLCKPLHPRKLLMYIANLGPAFDMQMAQIAKTVVRHREFSVQKS
jgi:DNA-binding response OmpR family regulator